MFYACVQRFDRMDEKILCGKLIPCLVRKNFQDSPSHQIFDRMYGSLNKDKNKN